MRKYNEQQNINNIEKLLKKFKMINEALEDRQNEPEFKDIFREVQLYIEMDIESLSFADIEKHKAKMESLDKKLPDIGDLEGMLSSVKFQQPLAQKMMDEKIEKVIQDRSTFTLGQVSELVRKRLSLVSIFQMYDDIHLENEKMNAELHI